MPNSFETVQRKLRVLQCIISVLAVAVLGMFGYMAFSNANDLTNNCQSRKAGIAYANQRTKAIRTFMEYEASKKDAGEAAYIKSLAVDVADLPPAEC